MNMITLAMLGWPEIVMILVVVLILFGAKKLPELAKGLGSGIKEFKKATKDVQDDLQRAIEDDDDRPSSRPSYPKEPTREKVEKQPEAEVAKD
jgi:sec-independent protein translocase protein TatA